MKATVPTLYLRWEAVVGAVLDRTIGFPKTVRFTFAQRIDNLALDVLEDIVEARYATKARTQVFLQSANGKLARLRALLRLAHARRFLDSTSFAHLSRELDESGRMLGGWLRQQGAVDGS